MSIPTRTVNQRLVALEHANDIRHRRSVAKRDLRAGRVNVADYIASPPEWMLTMKIVDLLLATPKIGRVKANQILWRCRVSPSKTVGGISDRQRGEILDKLPTPRLRSAA
jgi:hypothetical protein